MLGTKVPKTGNTSNDKNIFTGSNDTVFSPSYLISIKNCSFIAMPLVMVSVFWIFWGVARKVWPKRAWPWSGCGIMVGYLGSLRFMYIVTFPPQQLCNKVEKSIVRIGVDSGVSGSVIFILQIWEKNFFWGVAIRTLGWILGVRVRFLKILSILAFLFNWPSWALAFLLNWPSWVLAF